MADDAAHAIEEPPLAQVPGSVQRDGCCGPLEAADFRVGQPTAVACPGTSIDVPIIISDPFLEW